MLVLLLAVTQFEFNMNDREEDNMLPPLDKGRDIDEIFDDIGFGWYQWQLLIIVGISFSCDCMEIQLLAFIQGCVKVEWGLSDSIEALLTSMVFVGQIIGMLTLCPLAGIFSMIQRFTRYSTILSR